MESAAPRKNVFRTIAHPTRRALLDRLQRRGEQAVHELSEPFGMSQPALSQHLRVLRESGLVEARKEGRQRLYRLVSLAQLATSGEGTVARNRLGLGARD